MTNPTFDLATKQGYLAFHRNCCEKLMDITTRKNADYTGDSSSPFANFQAVANINICSVETGFIVRMTDKLMRISALSGGGKVAKVSDESIEDTLLDLANYSILLAGYIKFRSQGEKWEIVARSRLSGGDVRVATYNNESSANNNLARLRNEWGQDFVLTVRMETAPVAMSWSTGETDESQKVT